jgi:hypothetical protein
VFARLCLLLIRGILAAHWQKFHLPACPNLADHFNWTAGQVRDGRNKGNYVAIVTSIMIHARSLVGRGEFSARSLRALCWRRSGPDVNLRLECTGTVSSSGLPDEYQGLLIERSAMNGMAFGRCFVGHLNDHFGLPAPAPGSGVLFNVVNLALAGWTIMRQSRRRFRLREADASA